MYDELIKRLRETPSIPVDAKLHNEAADAIEELCNNAIACEEIIDKLESKSQKWIPVTERLPEENGHYLVHAVGNGYCSTYIALWNGRFRANFEMPITHWMPLPQPPRDGEA